MSKLTALVCSLAALVPAALLTRSEEPPRPAPRPAPEGAALATEARTAHRAVLAGGRRDAWLFVGFQAREAERLPRLPMNLALVIDRSGSMGSEDKLVHAKAAAEQLVSRLRPEDRLAIVAYDDSIRTLVPSTTLEDEDSIRAAIRGLAPGGSTDLHGGMVEGAEQVRGSHDPERLNRVLLLSDGLANHGVSNRGAIQRRASRCFEEGVQITTMGMGLQYDEDLLVGIAREAGGNYYYVDHAEAVGRHLDSEIDRMAQVVARHVELRVALGDGVRVGDVYGYAHRMDGRTLVVQVPDLISAQRRKVVVRLEVEGQAGETRRLARTEVRFRDVLADERFVSVHDPVDVAFTDDPAEVRAGRDLEVLAKVEVVRNATALLDAMELQKAGDFQGAQELLAARYLNSRTFNEAELKSAEVERILEKLRQTMEDLERTRADATARRDLQLGTQLEALGYTGD